ncbi:hypothetical protein rosag_20880 [Roseisolibacter agri]|uniref:Uncharacterized protein n=1 Tax=Roseisolibacter agri TaxID=2014610 RepID=A0AA37QFR0_9BACT|nr:hypothetical protein rosag_20880 [Roseisolibacter agri]
MLPREPPKLRPAAIAATASRATKATPQGSTLAAPAAAPVRGAAPVVGALPAARPQRWQNLAPGLSGAPQPTQTLASRGAPQVEQNRPVPAAPHAGQGTDWVAGADMGSNLTTAENGTAEDGEAEDGTA